jgi:hypothetical protein
MDIADGNSFYWKAFLATIKPTRFLLFIFFANRAQERDGQDNAIPDRDIMPNAAREFQMSLILGFLREIHR